jgi:hypothetical protein
MVCGLVEWKAMHNAAKLVELVGALTISVPSLFWNGLTARTGWRYMFIAINQVGALLTEIPR